MPELDHATDIEQAGSFLGVQRGNLWFRMPGDSIVWRHAPIGDRALAAALAAELNDLMPARAVERFEEIWRAAIAAAGVDAYAPRRRKR